MKDPMLPGAAVVPEAAVLEAGDGLEPALPCPDPASSTPSA
jgi:hypothetical protein